MIFVEGFALFCVCVCVCVGNNMAPTTLRGCKTYAEHKAQEVKTAKRLGDPVAMGEKDILCLVVGFKEFSTSGPKTATGRMIVEHALFYHVGP